MARMKAECDRLEQMVALVDAAEEAQNGTEMMSDEASLLRRSQRREASEFTGNSDGPCPLVTESGEMRSE